MAEPGSPRPFHLPFRAGGEGVRWDRVALFYGIAFGIAVLITALVLAMDGRFLGNTVAQLAVAFLYMPAPLIAGLAVESRERRGYLITKVFQGMRARLPRILLVGLIAWAFLLVGQLGSTFILGNVLHAPAWA